MLLHCSLQPVAGDIVDISEAILVDENPPSLHDVNIESGGSLVFDPTVKLAFRAHNIYIYGAMEVGSEACPYTGQLTITITGKDIDGSFGFVNIQIQSIETPWWRILSKKKST